VQGEDYEKLCEALASEVETAGGTPGTLPNPHDEEGEGDEEQEDDELEEDVREDSDASGDEYGETAQV
jgi:hypothetical protein